MEVLAVSRIDIIGHNGNTGEHYSILTEAESLVHGDRNRDYGHPLDDFTKTAKMWEVIIGAPITAEQVGLCMIALKISRQLNRPKRDNMVDTAGYAETVQMVVDERHKREVLSSTFAPIEELGYVESEQD